MKLEDFPVKSLSAVRARDRAAWLALFADDAVVEDPVGGHPAWDQTGQGQRGKEAIGRFYDTFSAGQDSFDFEIHYCVACGQEVAVYATFHIGLKNGAKMDMNLVIVYRISPVGRVASLRAFWR